MTAGGHDLGEALRRELHAAVEAIEPGADNLARIRSRMRVPWHARVTLALARPGLPVRAAWAVRRRLSPAASWLQAALGAVSSRVRPAPGPGGYRWLRPAAAFATGVFVLAAGSWAATALPEAISTSFHGSSGGSPSSPGPSGAPGTGQSHTGQPGGTPTGSTRLSPTSSRTCRPAASGSAAPSSQPSSSPSSSPSPSPSPSPSGSPSPSPSPSPSSTSGSPSPSPSLSTGAPSAALLGSRGHQVRLTGRPKHSPAPKPSRTGSGCR